MPNVLAKLGADVLGINPNVSTAGIIGFDRAVHAARLVELVKSSGANLGAMLDPDGEQLTLVDDTGHVLDDDEALLAIALLVSNSQPGSVIAVPVDASQEVEAICSATGTQVLRTKLSGRQLDRGVRLGNSRLGCKHLRRLRLPSVPTGLRRRRHFGEALVAARLEARNAFRDRRPASEDLCRKARGADALRAKRPCHADSGRTGRPLRTGPARRPEDDRRRRLDPGTSRPGCSRHPNLCRGRDPG